MEFSYTPIKEKTKFKIYKIIPGETENSSEEKVEEEKEIVKPIRLPEAMKLKKIKGGK